MSGRLLAPSLLRGNLEAGGALFIFKRRGERTKMFARLMLARSMIGQSLIIEFVVVDLLHKYIFGVLYLNF